MTNHERDNLVRETIRRIEKEYLFCEIGNKFYVQYIVDCLINDGYTRAKDVPQAKFAQLCRDNADPGEITLAELRDIERDLEPEAVLSPQVEAAFDLVDALLLHEQSERMMDSTNALSSAERLIAVLGSEAIREARESMARKLKEIKADPSLVIKAAGSE